MAAEATRALLEAAEVVRALAAKKRHELEEAEGQAWRVLEKALKAAKGKPEALQSISDHDARRILEFLEQWGRKKRVLKKKAYELIDIALSSNAWLRAVHSDAKLAGIMLVGVASMLEQDPTSASLCQLQRKLRDSPPPVEEELTKSPLPEVFTDTDEIRNRLRQSVEVMVKFNWVFPAPDHATLHRDEAIRGFSILYQELAKLSLQCQARQQQQQQLDLPVLQSLGLSWAKLMRFLETLCDAKTMYTKQAAFVVKRMRDFSQPFRDFLALEDPDLRFLGEELDGSWDMSYQFRQRTTLRSN